MTWNNSKLAVRALTERNVPKARAKEYVHNGMHQLQADKTEFSNAQAAGVNRAAIEDHIDWVARSLGGK